MTTGDMGNGVDFFNAIASGEAKCEYESIGEAKTVGVRCGRHQTIKPWARPCRELDYLSLRRG